MSGVKIVSDVEIGFVLCGVYMSLRSVTTNEKILAEELRVYVQRPLMMENTLKDLVEAIKFSLVPMDMKPDHLSYQIDLLPDGNYRVHQDTIAGITAVEA